MIRSFGDAGVLITGARSEESASEVAIRLLSSRDRIFLTSPFMHLEVAPKAVYYKKRDEQAFYEA